MVNIASYDPYYVDTSLAQWEEGGFIVEEGLPPP